MMPLFWLDFEAHVTPELMQQFHTFDYLVLSGQILAAIILFVGVFCIYRTIKCYLGTPCLENLQIGDILNREEYLSSHTNDKVDTRLLNGSPILDAENNFRILQHSKSVDSGHISAETSSQETV